MTAVERGRVLAESSLSIIMKLRCLAPPKLDPIKALAGFMIGSAAADGRISEREYLLIYPSLVCVFGDELDLAAIKGSFRLAPSGRRMLEKYTEDMLRIFELIDDELKNDVLLLCLCVVAIDGRISLREKNYIRRLCRA